MDLELSLPLMIRLSAFLFLFSTAFLRAEITPIDLAVVHYPAAKEREKTETFLSWHLKTDTPAQRGQSQKGYEILAASSKKALANGKADLWQNRQEKSGAQLYLPWEGKPLKNGAPVFWKVRLLDQAGKWTSWSEPATFTLGEKRDLPPIKRTSTFESDFAPLDESMKKGLTFLEGSLPQINKDQGTLKFVTQGAQVALSARAAFFHFNAAPHLRRYLLDLHAAADGRGLFPASPSSTKGGPGSSDAGIYLAQDYYWMTGDTRLIASQFPIMDQHMVARENEDRTFRGRVWGEVPIALTSPKVPTDSAYLDLAYIGYATRLMSQLAGPGNEPMTSIRYTDFASRLRKSVAANFLDENQLPQPLTQTALLAGIRSQILPKEEQASHLAKLTELLEKDGLQAEPLGLAWLFPTLTLTNQTDLLMDLIEANAKDWQDGKGEKVPPALLTWAVNSVLGIDVAGQGFAQISVHPRVPRHPKLTRASGSVQTPRGAVEVAWERKNKTFTMDLTVPPGMTAIANMPTSDAKKLTENGQKVIAKDSKITAIPSGSPAGYQTLLLTSGQYSFSSPLE